jgi:hypothetical protein
MKPTSRVQQEHGVEYHKYWFNQHSGKIFCICSAPSRDAAAMVHRKAHGLMGVKIIEVDPDLAEGILGGCEVSAGGAALVPGARPASATPERARSCSPTSSIPPPSPNASATTPPCAWSRPMTASFATLCAS